MTQDIEAPILDNQTWNSCPRCGHSWKDEEATPGLLHRTRLCANCADIEQQRQALSKNLRYEVSYVHLDGNCYYQGAFRWRRDAQAYAELLDHLVPAIARHRLPVIITDREDPERGNLNVGTVADLEALGAANE